MNFDRIYEYRFKGIPIEKKQSVWYEISQFLHREMGQPSIVLDPAAGFCEFINSIPAKERWAIDRNSKFLNEHSAPDIHKIIGDCMNAVVPTGYFDAVFVSNFLEHLGNTKVVYDFFTKAYQWLKPSGLLVVMGPNFKYCVGDYFDCSDHKVILTDISLTEIGYSAGFEIKKCHSRFLPYSFRSRLPTSPTLVHNYLRFPLIWPLLGKQFLVFFQKPL